MKKHVYSILKKEKEPRATFPPPPPPSFFGLEKVSFWRGVLSHHCTNPPFALFVHHECS